MTAEADAASLEAELARVADREPVVRAWVARHPEDELRRQAESLPAGPLRGWTIGVKDVIDTADLPTERGSPIYAGRHSANDAACVALARRAGALVTGKTVTTEFALFEPGPTTNPHDPDRTPGGSSSGSAAAVADGMVRAAFGTQTVGSVIRPAAFCGVVGFKPTYQLIAPTGVATLAYSFDTVGWLTRSVADSHTLFTALTHHRTPVPGTLCCGVGMDSPPPHVVPGTSDPKGRRVRVGRYRSHQWSGAEPETGEVLERAGEVLADAGIDVVDIDPLPHLEPVFDAADTVLRYEVARVFAWERANHEELISRAVRKMAASGDAIDGADYASAQRTLVSARRAHDDFLATEALDAVLTPSAPGEAPLLTTTGDSVFNRTWTALGVPCLQLPVGRGPNGLPLGIQLTGRSWRDAELLSVGDRIAQLGIDLSGR